jgi:hypothetical protein
MSFWAESDSESRLLWHVPRSMRTELATEPYPRLNGGKAVDDAQGHRKIDRISHRHEVYSVTCCT